MNKKLLAGITYIIMVVLLLNSIEVFASTRAKDRKVSLSLCCKQDNDFYVTLKENHIVCVRYNTPQEAINHAPEGSGLMILADNYPCNRTEVDAALFASAAGKKLRVYVEYPSMLPGMLLGNKAYVEIGRWGAVVERTVVSSDAFGPELPELSIMEMKDCHYVPVKAKNPDLVLARVEGYNSAVYGLPEKVHPLLFRHPGGNIMVATTKISQFKTGRYAPNDAWPHVLGMILKWTTGVSDLPLLKWDPSVRPMFPAAETLPRNARLNAIKRGVEYYGKSGLYIHPDWLEETPPGGPGNDSIPRAWPRGDGTYGIGECYISKRIFYNGRQMVSRAERADCNLEAAMGLAAGGVALLKDDAYMDKVKKLNDFVFRKSNICSGDRANPEKSSYGLLGWKTDVPEAFYGNDNARALICAVATSGFTGDNSWDEYIIRGILANFRTTGIGGFRPTRIEGEDLEAKGWEYYFNTDFEAELDPPQLVWYTYLWLYSKTGYKPLLERTKKGFEKLMASFPDLSPLQANRFEEGPCRLLHSLAWLVQVEDTPRHRAWLDTVAQYVMKIQDKTTGAIPQIPHIIVDSNEKYGTCECALAHKPGDPVTDALYSINFAFIGLHEAAAATGNKAYAEAARKMADFFIRTQTQSQQLQELDGTWYRGFDYKKWDYWGSDGDWGWGVWTNEIGWTHSWVLTTLALREMDTSLWEVASRVNVNPAMFEKYRKMMLPDNVLERKEKNQESK